MSFLRNRSSHQNEICQDYVKANSESYWHLKFKLKNLKMADGRDI